MATKGASMLLNLNLGIVGEGDFGIGVKDRVEVFDVKHCNVYENVDLFGLEDVRGWLDAT
jgi:hypothetical protein